MSGIMYSETEQLKIFLKLSKKKIEDLEQENTKLKSVVLKLPCKEKLGQLEKENEKLKEVLKNIQSIMDVKTYNNLDMAIQKELYSVESEVYGKSNSSEHSEGGSGE